MRFCSALILLSLITFLRITPAYSQSNLIPDSVEYSVLRNLYDSLGGAGWTNSTNWPTSGNWPQTVTSAQFGTWFGVTVSNGDINKIALSANNLIGLLPSSISKLTQLRYLYLENNSIGGSIPSSYGNLSGLLNFHLNHNQLTGTIPSALGNMVAVKRFRLQNNNLTGSIPASLGNLTAVTDFYVSYNQLTGSIPAELGNLINVEYFYLRNNQLTGTIPSTLSALTKVKYFAVGTNQLTGTIPASLSGMVALISFDVSTNQLSGEIPDIIGNWPNVTQLHLYTNKFTGQFPSSVGNSQALTLIYAQNNLLTSLPSGLLSLPVVTALTFYNNDISVIPDFSNQVNKVNLNLQVQNNRLDFSQLEMIFQKGIKTLTFSGQKNLDDLAYVKVVGGQLLIPARNAGVSGSYSWERKLEGSTSWTVVTSQNQDATNKTFLKNNLTELEDGQYRYKMTNSLFAPTVVIMSTSIAVRSHALDLVWSNHTGVTENNTILNKTTTAGWGNAGALSENGIISNQDGWIEFVADKSNSASNYAIGFSLTTNTTLPLASIDYGLQLSYSDMKVYAHEASAIGIDLGSWAVGDYFKIQRIGATIKYYKNGIELRSVTVDATKNYLVKVLLNEGMSPPVTSSFGIHPSRGLVYDRDELAALKAIYDSLGGVNWIRKTNWPVGTGWNQTFTAAQMDTWFGITSAGGDITRVELQSNGLVGVIPAAIGKLKSMNLLRLQSNAISGKIPTAIGDLTALTFLNLAINNITGTIPSSVGNLTNLTWLGLYRTQLTGSVPASIFNLPNLENLYIYFTNVSGAIPPEIGNLPKIKLIYMYRNQLTGSIPSTIGNLTTLTNLAFEGNPQLGGTIPESIGNLVNLTELWLNESNFSGPIPTSIGNLTQLRFLNLFKNHLTGTMPPSMANLVNLDWMALSENELTGTIPSYLANMTKLDSLWLNDNQLTGNLPVEMQTITSLALLNVHNNQLQGTIPGWLGLLTKLKTLSLGGNQFTGTIPTSLSTLINLTGLYINNTQIEGTIPSQLQGLSKLKYIDLKYTNLSGEIPLWLMTKPTVKQFVLNNSKFTSLPDFSSRTDKATLKINIENNQLPVSDLERYFTPAGVHPFNTFTYAPQQISNQPPPIVDIPLGEDLLLVAPLAGTNGVYVWEKQNGNGWINVTSQNQSGVPNEFLLQNMTPAMEGTYRYTVTNTIIPGLTYTHTTVVNITEAINEDPIPRLYNGLITAMHWRTEKADGATTDLKGSYFFTYDDKYQIQEARWGENANFITGTFNWVANRNRLTGMTYDPNGNILTLKRYDDTGNMKHDFTYHYANSLQPAISWQQAATNSANQNNDQERNQLLDVAGYTTNSNTAQHGFTYNAIGQMTNEDLLDGQDQYVGYDVTGKVRKVFSDEARTKLKVEFTYDDRGFRLSKTNYDDSATPQPKHTTWYIRDASGNILSIFEEDHTQNSFVQTEIPVYGSGKLGTYYASQDGSVAYELTDHLGNVRAVVRDNIAIYKATLENSGATDYTNPRVTELQLFRNIEETEVDDPNFNHTPINATTVATPNKSAYLFWQSGVVGMDAPDKSIGPSIALQVRGGDSLRLETYARYESKANYGSRSVGLAALATYLGGNYAFTGAFEGATTAQTAQSIQNGLTAAAWGNDNTDQTRPFAYLNYIVFDNNMVYKTAGWQRVSTAAAFTPGQEVISMNPGVNFEHITFNAPIPITADGYIYVWVSNESENTKVWFDDITVTHTQNLITQATDYGVWGDILREQKSPEDLFYRFGYQGQFAERDEETGWNHFELREYDANIGRWLVPDLYRQYWSPYLSMGNNPINLIDINGGFSDDPKPGQLNWDNTKVWGLNASTNEYEWSDLLGEVVVEPTFRDFLSDLDDLFSGDIGIRIWGNGKDNFIGGNARRPKYLIDVSAERLNELLSLHKEWNRPGGSRFNSNTLNNENPKTSDDLGKIKESMKSLYDAYKIKNERFHGFVRRMYYSEGKDDYAYDTLPSDRSPYTGWKMDDSVVVAPENRDYWRLKGEKQRKLNK